MKKFLTICAALAVSISFATAADEAKEKKPGMTAEQRFEKLDANKDGKISMDEMNASQAAKKDPAKAEAMFKKKDKDSDGKLSMEEFGVKKDAAEKTATNPVKTQSGAGKPEPGGSGNVVPPTEKKK